MITPRLKNVQKIKPPYKINKFSKNFIVNIARDIVYLLATKGEARLEGSDWEKIFADAIGAKWAPSNVGLDDIIFKNCAWGAKTVKSKYPSKAKKVRLISGRNSPVYSYGANISTKSDPLIIGKEVLSIWNARVEHLYQKYKFIRTVVLLKSDDLCELAVFEFDTIRYNTDTYVWHWNKRGNLEGYDENSVHKFTWQPHGSQFTIIELVPKDRTAFKIIKPKLLDKRKMLEQIGFDESWVSIIK